MVQHLAQSLRGLLHIVPGRAKAVSTASVAVVGSQEYVIKQHLVCRDLGSKSGNIVALPSAERTY